MLSLQTVMCKSHPENQSWGPVGRRWKQGWPGPPRLPEHHPKATYLVGWPTYCDATMLKALALGLKEFNGTVADSFLG